MLLPYICANNKLPHKCHIYMQHMKISSFEDMRQTMSVYIPHINNLIRNTGIHFILLTYPLTYMPVTACLLHSTYRPKSTKPISNITNKMQLEFTMLLPYMCKQLICSQMPIYVTCPDYSICINIGSRLNHMMSSAALKRQ